eukprot:CAMPEP_0206226800 /NCGR_PEP_ID=MMETSP0047_2-20121206/8285_1 /ASSEMBLY_ACC=CAM_ASM_000192 /TAXON_ID=195065 /ORGANISM="Chroomonas mesostigmatica_cf, Strain CCMP1168" /LENGTH=415 /DNA_ID=CAMNT_0053649913 /DNA_START=180 /DNA_END=1424 /DNA_ORIENTATION=+
MASFRLGRGLLAAIGGTGLAGAAVALAPYPLAGDIKEKFGTGLYKHVLWQGVRLLDPETAHGLSIMAAKYRLTPTDRVPDDPSLAVETLGSKFTNPLGLAAGCDHNAEAVEAFTSMGFGFVEIGTVTPARQEGNKKPRVFRLEEDRGVINRVGYANVGVDEVGERLKGLRQAGFKGKIGVNVGFCKGAGTVPGDLQLGLQVCAPYADYVVINAAQLYHPPIPAFRDIKAQPTELSCILKAVMAYRRMAHPTVPMLVKIHPDFTDQQLREVCKVIMAEGYDGIIVSAPSGQRPETIKSSVKEFGGLSGAPMKDASTQCLRKVYEYTGGKVPLIGVGGVMSGQDAYEKIRAGASLVQMYSGLAYEGPFIVPRIKWDLAELARKDGFATVQAAVGADVKMNLLTAAGSDTGKRAGFLW